ncbi:glutamate-1-semialdehyde 2,1-aminomutase [Fusarium globosum]|uniref:Glutamate-1-semialdehyde 2,1-aminomutase n=1 Tax=Fusarium globosum TaxID=78864 RepID=A0A8H5XVH8_9HYPO|nr:glutamate-1-semialdehyde 2,1-aminomutase [Fusarium globosum]
MFAARGMSPPAAAPIVCGIWYPDDVEDGSDVVEIVVDEVKYVIAGESTWECATTGRKFHASTGSMIWLPKNCKAIRRYSKGLKTFYVEQDYRKPTSLEDPGTAYLARLDALYISGETAFRSANPQSLGLHQARIVEFKTNGTLHPSSSSGQFPLFMERGSGNSVVSVDGTDYLDFSYDPSAGVIGHANPELLDSLRTALEIDTNLGDATSKEVQLARALKARFRSLEALRFCVLQTEAVAIALSLAVNATGKNKIMTFRPGHITTSSHDLVAAIYNDMESVSKQVSSDVATILVEP